MSAVCVNFPSSVCAPDAQSAVEIMLLMFEPPISFHRCFVSITGSVDSALILTVACDATLNTPVSDEAWFVMSKEDWEERTKLSHKQQLNARKVLMSLGLLTERRTGYPCELHHKINMKRLSELLRQHADESAPRLRYASDKGLQ